MEKDELLELNRKDFKDIDIHSDCSRKDCIIAFIEHASSIFERKITIKKRKDDDNNNDNHDKEYQKNSKKKVKREGNRNISQENTNNDQSSSQLQSLPSEFRDALERLAGGKLIEEVNLMLKKNIYSTDVSKTHNRLSLPTNLHQYPFLREEEKEYLKSSTQINGRNVMNSIEVDVIEPSLETSTLDLKRWAMSKGMYVLTRNWNKIVSKNSIKAEENLEIWTARVEQKLCFLLVRIPETDKA